MADKLEVGKNETEEMDGGREIGPAKGGVRSLLEVLSVDDIRTSKFLKNRESPAKRDWSLSRFIGTSLRQAFALQKHFFNTP